ncbi:MAG TPA: hypothetical protein VLX68_07500 [Chitinivibrionales bacterium]|nr:hypothetical protein [Chitinivibrionales bacterium]
MPLRGGVGRQCAPAHPTVRPNAKSKSKEFWRGLELRLGRGIFSFLVLSQEQTYSDDAKSLLKNERPKLIKYLVTVLLIVVVLVVLLLTMNHSHPINMNAINVVMNSLFIVTALAGIVLSVVAYGRKKNLALLTICTVFVLELVLVYGNYAVTKHLLTVNQLEMQGTAYAGYSSDTTVNARFVQEKRVGGYRFKIPLGNILLLLAVWQLGWDRKNNNSP